MSCSPLWPSIAICGGRGTCIDETCKCNTDYTGKGDFMSTNKSCMTNVIAIRVLWSCECLMACYALYVLIRQWRTTRASLASTIEKQSTSTSHPSPVTHRITNRRSCDTLRTLFHDFHTHPHLYTNLSSIFVQISFLCIVLCKWINPMTSNITYDIAPTIFFMMGLQSYNGASTVHIYCFFKVLLTFTRFQNSSSPHNTRDIITLIQRVYIIIAIINFMTANMIPIIMLGMEEQSKHQIGTTLFFALKTISYLCAATVMSIFGRSVISQLDAMPELHVPPIISKHVRTSSHAPSMTMTVQVTPIKATMTASSSLEQMDKYRTELQQQHKIDEKLHGSPSPTIVEEKSMGNLFITTTTVASIPSIPTTHVTSHQRAPTHPITQRSFRSAKQSHIDGLSRHIHVLSITGFIFACINFIFAIWPLAHLYVSYFLPIMCMMLSMHCASVATAAKKHG